VQEDLAVTRTQAGTDWVAALHVCSPSDWSPEAKIGRSFTAVHAPVPGMEALFPAADALVEATVRRGPWVRFVWGVSGDQRLNHHPEPPTGVPPARWRDRGFRPRAREPFYFRVERQVLWGLPDVGASLFVIAPCHVPATALTPEERAALRSALLGMSEESRAYKGIAHCWRQLVDWLA
jgi:hypothetical protein